MRQRDLVLLVGFVVVAVLAGILGQRSSPKALGDPRHSTYLAGPAGTRALAEALAAFDMTVERRRLPLFGVRDDLAKRPATLAVIAPPFGITDAEIAEVGDLVRDGGAVVLVGASGIERDLGFQIVSLPGRAGTDDDSLAVVAPPSIGALPGVWQVVSLAKPRSGERPPPRLDRLDTLVAGSNGRAAAVRAWFAGGGQALIVADPEWAANRVLRDTDVGALLVPWIVDLGPRAVMVDEYHQGFGRRGALVGAVWRWLRSGPAGWAMLQLLFAGLVSLAAAAIRFGPALHVIPRRRRSPLEHVDALAAGLARSGASGTAVLLLASGLQRRLRSVGRATGRFPTDPRAQERWLGRLTRASDAPEAQHTVKRLGWLLRERGGSDERVLQAAEAVEDVWDVLKQRGGPARS